MARILVTGLHYWPEVSGNAPYTTASCEHLAGKGHDVTVLTGMPHYPAWRIDPAYRGRMTSTERKGGVLILRRGHYVPSRQTAQGRALMEVTSSLTGSLVRPSRPDAILGIVPALSGAVLARGHSMRTRAPYGLLFHDLMGRAAAQSGIERGPGVAAVTTAIEGWGARSATAIGIVAESFRSYFEDLDIDPGRIVSVPNWTRIEAPTADPDATRRRLGWKQEDRIVLHSGNMGMKQGLEQVIETAELAAATAPDFRFVFVGDGNQRRSLERMAAELGNCEFRPFEAEDAYPNVLAAADVLLVSERSSVVDMSIPSKLASYLASGRPILAAVTAGGEAAELVRRSGGGVVVDAGEPAAILAALRGLIDDPDLGGRLGTAGRAFADLELAADRGLARVEVLVNRILDGRGSRGDRDDRAG